MDKNVLNIFKTKIEEKEYNKLARIESPELHRFIAEYIELCNPDSVFVCTDQPSDIKYIRQKAIENGEERELAVKGHTVHFDGYHDQARDKANTKFLLPKGVSLGHGINALDREEGLGEIHGIMKGIMKGHELYIRFFCLGPANSEFSIPCVQLTDSAYVVHSEALLYRKGYEEFKREGASAHFFKFVHSAGELDERNVSKNIEKRRIYIDIEGGTVYSANTQYGGNTIGLKKLALRLAIARASKEGWLAEHMFVMGVHGPGSRMTYFTGAFPSLCGKTSTSMLPGENIVGDDIAYLRKRNGKVYAVNVESGMFGIIMGITSKDDPIIWEALHSPGELILSNVLAGKDNKPYWIGMDGEIPEEGQNYSGQWHKGEKDDKGNELTPSHRNARFTIALKDLSNVDPRLDDPAGFESDGIIYGGRDSDTCVPVQQAFNWAHGIITQGASLESETTAATLGKAGVRKFNPMSNLDFVSIPLGRYIKNNLDFGEGLEEPPCVFGVNYFLKDKEGRFLNQRMDKKVWLKWMELRVHNEVEAIEMPTGLVPKYEDLRRLFKEVLGKDYSEEDYVKQFTLRIPEKLAKIDRILNIYKTKVLDAPKILFEVLEEQKEGLEKAKEKFGDYVSPLNWT